ncbi:MAG: nicotinamide riboside transporter PnuC [Bacteroidales bacterium]
MYEILTSWILNHWIELAGTLCGFIYIFLEIKQHIWLWPIGIITAIFYVIVYYYAKFYADMSLQFYYIFISIYGWYFWIYGTKTRKEIPVTRIPRIACRNVLIISCILMGALGFFLQHYTDSPVPWGDAFTTSFSITATWMLARKYIEQWWFWIGINIVSIFLYIEKELYPTSILFFVYLTLAIIGYIQWRKSMNQTKTHVSL